MSKRIVFGFDTRSYEALEALRRDGGFPTLAEALRTALEIRRALQAQIDQGFTELIVRNPETDRERVMVL